MQIFSKIKTPFFAFFSFFSFLFLVFSSAAFADIATVAPISIDPNSLTAFSGITTTNAPTRASVGDFNCDGINDIMIAAPGYSGSKGRIYVFFGPGLSSSTLASGNADVAIKGDYSNNGIGSASFFYDVDEDGCDDIVTGASRQVPAYERIHVIPGSPVWNAGYDDTLSTIPTIFSGYNYYTVEHTASESYAYLHLLGPLDGDVTGDGVVTNGDNYLAVCSGYTVKCMLMPVANLLTATNFVSASNYYVNSTAPMESITSGDLDNDGFDDLVFADPDYAILEDNVSVVFGPLATSPSKLTGSPLPNLPSEYFTSSNILGNDIQIRNADPSTNAFGLYVETAKLFGTNADDLVIGAPFEDCGPATEAGRFHLISSESLMALRDSVSTGSGLVIYSDTTNGTYNYGDIDVLLLGGDTDNAKFARFYKNGHLGGDYNGDGVIDPVLGGSNYYNPGITAGVMHVIFGGNLEASLGNEFHLGTAFANSHYMMLGDSDDSLGYFTTSGDVTGDGLDDLLVLRPGAGFGEIVVWEGVVTDLDNDGVDSNVDCDEYDNTLGGPQVFYQDTDGDGFGNLGVPSASVCTAPANFVNNSDDCDDTNVAMSPGATEICDGLDNNCALGADEGLPTYTYYIDNDGDGVGAGSAFVTCQVNPTGYVISSTDCNDSNASIFPSASEICDNVDNNCSGTIDEGLTTYTYYIDNDGDGAGLATASTTTCQASVPTGYVANSNDCNDNNASLITPIDYYADADGDGFGNPSASLGACATAPPTGYVADATDCNDSSGNTHPGATELCDGLDNNCNGTTDDGVSYVDYYPDADGDGFGSTSSPQVACEQPTGYVQNNTDCNDALYDLNNNCTPVVVDNDSDGFSVATGDCNDNNNLVFPGAGEYCDAIDNNCDGTIDEDSSLDALTWFEDTDNDGYGDSTTSVVSCSAPTGYVADSTDCDPLTTDATNNCTTVVGDDDEDGITVADGDCNDNNEDIYPGAPELADTLDNDCDNQFDEFMMQLRATGGTTINAIGVKSGGESFNISLVASNASGFTSFSAQVYMLEDSYQTLTSSNSGPWFTFGKRQVRASQSPTTYTCGTNNQNCDLIGSQNVVLSNNGSDISFSVNATIPMKIADGNYGVFVKLYGTTADGNQILLKTVSPYGYTTLSQIWNAFGNVPDFFDTNGNGSLDPGEVSNLIAVVQ